MVVKEWLDTIIEKGVLCDGYKEKVQKALNKKDMMDIVLDANGVSWIPEQIAKGRCVSYKAMYKEFWPFLNGRYKAKFQQETGEYTSSMYVGIHNERDLSGVLFGNVFVDTTLCVLLDIQGDVEIAKNHVAKIYLDQNCDVRIIVPETSKCIVYYFVGAKIRNFKELKKHRGVYVWEWKDGD